jgi:hypothetical protein
LASEVLAPFAASSEWSREIRIAGDWTLARFDVLEGGRATLVSATDAKAKTMILGGTGSPGSLARAVLRRIRDLQQLEAVAAGALPLHAACVELGGAGVLICGDKWAGKTTTTIDLITSGASSFVCNDKALVWFDDEIWVQGVPRSIAIRPPTIERFPILLGATDRYDDHDEDGPTGRICLPPWSLSEACGVRWSVEAKPAVMIFPEFVPELTALEISRLSLGSSLEALSGSFLGNYFPHSPELERTAHARARLGPIERTAQLEALAHRCAAYRVRQGPNTPGRLAEEIRARL